MFYLWTSRNLYRVISILLFYFSVIFYIFVDEKLTLSLKKIDILLQIFKKTLCYTK